MSDTLEYFNAGQLSDALQSCIAEVREHPTDIDQRWILAVLLCFNGDYERADKHLQTILSAAPDLAGDVLLFRNLLRGEIARRQCFEEGRVPAFPEPPSESHQQLLRALALEVSDEAATAADLIREVIAKLPVIPGQCNERSFNGIRDWDDFLATVVEVITVNGDYYWLALEQIRQIDFQPIEEMRDMLWRSASITTVDGEAFTAYFPMLYPGTVDETDETLRLGRAADWIETHEGILRGKGVRSWDIGGQTEPLPQINRLKITPL